MPQSSGKAISRTRPTCCNVSPIPALPLALWLCRLAARTPAPPLRWPPALTFAPPLWGQPRASTLPVFLHCVGWAKCCERAESRPAHHACPPACNLMCANPRCLHSVLQLCMEWQTCVSFHIINFTCLALKAPKASPTCVLRLTGAVHRFHLPGPPQGGSAMAAAARWHAANKYIKGVGERATGWGGGVGAATRRSPSQVWGTEGQGRVPSQQELLLVTGRGG